MSSSVDGRLRRSCWELKSDGGVSLNLAWRQSDWLYCVDGEILKAELFLCLSRISTFRPTDFRITSSFRKIMQLILLFRFLFKVSFVV